METVILFYGSDFLVIIAIILYFIPSFVASNRRDSAAVFWLNLLLGWTVIGWIGSLIWALSSSYRGSRFSNSYFRKTWSEKRI